MAHLHHAKANTKVTSEFNSNNYKKILSLCSPSLRGNDFENSFTRNYKTIRTSDLTSGAPAEDSVNHEAVNVNLCGHTLQSNVMKKSVKICIWGTRTFPRISIFN